MTDFVHDGGSTTIIVRNPTITERAARVLGQYFRPIGNSWTTEQQGRPREIPEPFEDTRTSESRATRSTYFEDQEQLEQKDYGSMADHGASKGGGAGEGFANFGTGILALAVAFFLVVVIVGWLLNSTWPRGGVVIYGGISGTGGGSTVTNGSCGSPQFSSSEDGVSYFRLPNC